MKGDKLICRNCKNEFIDNNHKEYRKYCCKKCEEQFRHGKTYEEWVGKERAVQIVNNVKEGLKPIYANVIKKDKYYCNYEKICPICNKSFKVETKHQHKKFCSRECRIKYSIGKSIEELYGLEKAQKERSRLLEWRKDLILPIMDTKIEVKIQNFLKELKIGFFCHYYCKEIDHAYQCDIFIPVQRNRDRFIKQPIVIECDGDYWHKYPTGNEKDHIRTKELQDKGFKVIRLWEREIKVMSIDKFKEIII